MGLRCSNKGLRLTAHATMETGTDDGASSELPPTQYTVHIDSVSCQFTAIVGC